MGQKVDSDPDPDPDPGKELQKKESVMKRRVIIGFFVFFLILTLGGSQDARGAQGPGEFYQGKTLRWIVASSAGGPTDLLVRTITPFLEKEIGARVRIEDRDGDEGINYLYTKGTRDGLILGTKTSDAIIGNDILKAPGAQYEADKFIYLADIFPSGKVLQISPKLPYKNLDGLRKAKGLRVGGTSAKGAIAMSGAAMIGILNLDARLITGFKGKKDLTLAMARGEIDVMVTSDSSALRDEKDGYVVNVMVLGSKKSAAAPDVPTMAELGVRVPKELASVYKFVISGGMVVALPPGVPAERVEYLRQAFQRLENNKDLRKAIEKLTGQVTGFLSGQEVQQAMEEIKADTAAAAKLDSLFKKYTVVR